VKGGSEGRECNGVKGGVAKAGVKGGGENGGSEKHGGVYGLLSSYYFFLIIHVCTSTDNRVAPMYHLSYLVSAHYIL
jgi:hypothetical protein